MKKVSRRAKAAGKVKLALKPAKPAIAKLREAGSAKVTAKVTFTRAAASRGRER